MQKFYPLAVHAIAGTSTAAFAFFNVPHASSAFIHLGYSLLFGLTWPLFWAWQLIRLILP
jgi:hypothetical protein